MLSSQKFENIPEVTYASLMAKLDMILIFWRDLDLVCDITTTNLGTFMKL